MQGISPDIFEGENMSENEWGDLEAVFVATLRETKTEPVPAEIIKLAQRSLAGFTQPDGTVLHAMQLPFGTIERATAFAKHMRNAGQHTTPVSSITVVQDPDRKRTAKLDEQGNPVLNDAGKPVMVPGAPVNPLVVAWRAGAKKGRQAVDTPAA
jgi:hypothetical protein